MTWLYCGLYISREAWMTNAAQGRQLALFSQNVTERR